MAMRSRDTTIAVLVAAAYMAACLVHGWSVDYYVSLNDFWGNAFAASRWELRARALWNGFYPPGYPTLLAALPGERLIASAFVVNAVAGAATLLVVWAAARRVEGALAAFAAMTVVGLHPLFVTQVLTTGADVIFVLLALGGAVVLFDAMTAEAPSPRKALAAGLLLGVSGWVRYHAFAWSAALFVAALAVGGWRRWRTLAVAALPVAVAGTGLLLLGLAAGDLAALQRDQAFNVYSHLVTGVNWFHVAQERLPVSVGDAIRRDPQAFVRNYLAFTAPHLWYVAALGVATAIGLGRARRFAGYALVTTIVFVPWVNLGGSPRGHASLVPLLLTAVTVAVVSRLSAWPADARGRALRLAAAVTAVGWAAWTWVPGTVQFLRDTRVRAAFSRQVERVLLDDRVRLGAQVFSVADFYFVSARGRSLRTYHPHVMGGWPTVDLDGFLETYPPPNTRSLDAFLDDCLRVGVTHLVLSDAAGQVLRELGQLYDGRLTSDRVVDLASLPGVRVFRIRG